MMHSLIAPSSAHIWGSPEGCTGYVTMLQSYPEKPSDDSREGDAAHELGARMIGELLNGGLIPDKKSVINKPASNGVIYTDEIYDSALTYALDVGEIRNKINSQIVFGIEERLECKRVHPQSFGTCDMNLFVVYPKVLYVWDFKHGHGAIEVFENWQIINYVAGLLDKYELLFGALDLDIQVIARIVQPRAFHRDGVVREWSFRASDVRAQINILASNAQKALGPNAELHSGAHCRYCPARHACPAALAAGVALYEAIRAPVPEELTPEAMALQYSIVKRAKEQISFLESGYEEQLRALISRGVNVPGYVLEESYGSEAWAKPIEEIEALGDLMEVDLRVPKVLTPRQAKQAGIPADMVSAYSHRPKTGLKLAPISNFNGRKIFS